MPYYLFNYPLYPHVGHKATLVPLYTSIRTSSKYTSANIYNRLVCFPMGLAFPLHNIPSQGVLMKSIGVDFLWLCALPGVNHMHGIKYKIVINISFGSELN